MKKITLILATLFISVFGFSQGDFNVPVNYGSRIASEFQARVIDSGGTYYPNIAAHEIDERTSYGTKPIFEFYAAASKDGTLYSHLPTDGTGDFTVTRDAFSTTLNEDGYYQNMLPDYPLIDYSNGIPVTLTQPQRIRLTTYPISFDNAAWTLSGATLDDNGGAGYPSPMLEPDLGSDIITPLDFTSGWTNLGGITDKTATTYTTTSAGGVYSYDMLTIGTNYKIVFTSDNSTVTVRNYDGAAHDPIILTGSGEIYFVAEYTKLYIRNNGAATTIVSELTIQEILPTATTPMTESYLMTATGADGYIELATPLVISNTTDYSNSICIKRVTGTGDISIKDINNAETVISEGIELSDGWSRYDVTSESTSTDGQIGVKLATSGDEVLIFFAQSEAGSYSTTPIWDGSEGATVTRVADAIGGNDFSALGDIYSIVIKFNLTQEISSSTTKQLFTLSGNYDGCLLIGIVTGDLTDELISFLQYSGNYSYYLSNSETLSVGNHAIALVWDGSKYQIYLDGAAKTTYTKLTPHLITQADDIGIGYGGTSSLNDMRTSEFILYDSALTSAQAIALTTP